MSGSDPSYFCGEAASLFAQAFALFVEAGGVLVEERLNAERVFWYSEQPS
jgi:hypothetical protein